MQPKRMSLTFNTDAFTVQQKMMLRDVNIGVYSVPIQSTNTFGTITTTNKFNKEFNDIYRNLNDIRQEYHLRVQELLGSGSEANDTLRNNGVKLAWKYEQAELQMGGDGSSNWSPSQKQEISVSGRARGAEGHHINNVSDYPAEQANPDNIRFAQDKSEHLKMHDGNFQNTTSGEAINRNERLDKTNSSRVFKNEIAGIGAAAAIGLGIGFALGFVVTLAQSGLSVENIKNAAIVGSKVGIEGAGLGIMNHLITRGIGEMATNALQGVANNLGIIVTDNIAYMCNMAIMGGLAIIVFSMYQFVKLKHQGYNTKECLLRVGKSAAFSATVLILSLVAQYIWGGFAGIVVSISIGVVVLVYKFRESKHQKYLSEQIRMYTIEKYQPVYSE